MDEAINYMDLNPFFADEQKQTVRHKTGTFPKDSRKRFLWRVAG